MREAFPAGGRGSRNMQLMGFASLCLLKIPEEKALRHKHLNREFTSCVLLFVYRRVCSCFRAWNPLAVQH